MTRIFAVCSVIPVVSMTLVAQDGRGAGALPGRGPVGRGGITAHNAATDDKPYDKHDLAGIWTRNGTPGGYGVGARAGIAAIADSATTSHPLHRSAKRCSMRISLLTGAC